MSILGDGGYDCCSWDLRQEGDLFIESYFPHCSIFTVTAEVTLVPSSATYPISSLNRRREKSSGSAQCDFPSRDSDQVVSGSREGRKYQDCMVRLQNQIRFSCWDRGSTFWCNYTLCCCFTSSQLAPGRELITNEYIEHCKYTELIIVNYLLGVTTEVLQGWVL